MVDNIYGYVRVSTQDQNEARQITAITAARSLTNGWLTALQLPALRILLTCLQRGKLARRFLFRYPVPLKRVPLQALIPAR